jgi:hypothetical protein
MQVSRPLQAIIAGSIILAGASLLDTLRGAPDEASTSRGDGLILAQQKRTTCPAQSLISACAKEDDVGSKRRRRASVLQVYERQRVTDLVRIDLDD